MKKYLLSIVCLSFMLPGLCQQSNADRYIKKSKTQKTVAWVLLGGGATLAVFGLITGVNDVASNYFLSEEKPKGEVTFYTGVVMSAASIPFFILSRKNAKKAALVLTNMRVPSLTAKVSYVPAVKIRITL